jgi:hypothetical protein
LNGKVDINWVGKSITFKELIERCEPVQLIQSGLFFCIWPSDEWHIWDTLSRQWARLCLDNELFFDEHDAIKYTRDFISADITMDYDKKKIYKI